jgi:hypothetical protein
MQKTSRVDDQEGISFRKKSLQVRLGTWQMKTLIMSEQGKRGNEKYFRSTGQHVCVNCPKYPLELESDACYLSLPSSLHTAASAQCSYYR